MDIFSFEALEFKGHHLESLTLSFLQCGLRVLKVRPHELKFQQQQFGVTTF